MIAINSHRLPHQKQQSTAHFNSSVGWFGKKCEIRCLKNWCSACWSWSSLWRLHMPNGAVIMEVAALIRLLGRFLNSKNCNPLKKFRFFFNFSNFSITSLNPCNPSPQLTLTPSNSSGPNRQWRRYYRCMNTGFCPYDYNTGHYYGRREMIRNLGGSW